MKQGWVYILRCTDGSYYTGSTSNLESRIAQHQNGTFPGYTVERRPVMIVWSDHFSDIRDALVAERQIKGWTRKKKEALMKGDFALLRRLAECVNESRAKVKMR